MHRYLTEELLLHHLDVLRHGGRDAITLFLQTCEQLYENAEPGVMRDWIRLGLAALPESERVELVDALVSRDLEAKLGGGKKGPDQVH